MHPPDFKELSAAAEKLRLTEQESWFVDAHEGTDDWIRAGRLKQQELGCVENIGPKTNDRFEHILL